MPEKGGSSLKPAKLVFFLLFLIGALFLMASTLRYDMNCVESPRRTVIQHCVILDRWTGTVREEFY